MRLLRVISLAALAPLLAGAHCNDDCGPPKTSLVKRPIERTIYGAALLVTERGAPLADALSSFDRRALEIDPSRPVAVVLTRSSSWGEASRLDGSKLRAGDRGPSFTTIGVIDNAGKVPLFHDKAALDDAKREGWDAVLLIPRARDAAPWQVAVAVEMGRTVTPVKEKGACVEHGAASGPPPSFKLGTLPVRCGDGVRQDDEECDDGNRRDGDGCSAFCAKER